MKFEDIGHWAEWVKYSGQSDSGVAYVYVASGPIARLRGDSDILYVGITDNAIRARIKWEMETNNTPGNTQNTNIRITHVLCRLKQSGISVTCFFTKEKSLTLSSEMAQGFAQKWKTWDKAAYNKAGDYSMPTIEKYLLVTYADEHLELPPLNNRF